jgi:hypothetical protein
VIRGGGRAGFPPTKTVAQLDCLQELGIVYLEPSWEGIRPSISDQDSSRQSPSRVEKLSSKTSFPRVEKLYSETRFLSMGVGDLWV